MKSISISAERSYDVHFVSSWTETLASFVRDREGVVLVPQSLLTHVHEVPPGFSLLPLPDGEDQKSGANFLQVLEKIAQTRLSRSGVIVGIGGGATTDLAGYLAASYLRGIDWIAIPTSLAGMVDASIGGKTGINLDSGKNLAGAFHSPNAVIIDESFLASLSQRDLVAGMAEVLKCGFIRDRRILELITDDWRKNLSELIYRSVAVKAEVVSQDFRESFEREVLNYGHTLGHAIEKESGYSMRHGECVAIGIHYAAELSYRFSGMPLDDLKLHRVLLQALGLPSEYRRESWPKLFEHMQSDKKKKNSLRFVTLRKIGEPTRLEDTSEEELRKTYEEVIGR